MFWGCTRYPRCRGTQPPKIDREGQPCRHGGTAVIRRLHSKAPTPRPGGSYFEWWFKCPACKAVYLVEVARRFFDAAGPTESTPTPADPTRTIPSWPFGLGQQGPGHPAVGVVRKYVREALPGGARRPPALQLAHQIPHHLVHRTAAVPRASRMLVTATQQNLLAVPTTMLVVPGKLPACHQWTRCTAQPFAYPGFAEFAVVILRIDFGSRVLRLAERRRHGSRTPPGSGHGQPAGVRGIRLLDGRRSRQLSSHRRRAFAPAPTTVRR